MNIGSTTSATHSAYQTALISGALSPTVAQALTQAYSTSDTSDSSSGSSGTSTTAVTSAISSAENSQLSSLQHMFGSLNSNANSSSTLLNISSTELVNPSLAGALAKYQYQQSLSSSSANTSASSAITSAQSSLLSSILNLLG